MIRALNQRFGSLGVTLVASLLAVSGTIGMTAIYDLVIKHAIPREDLLIGALASATIAPLVIYWLATLSYELYKSEQRLSALSQKDPLTGAYNRRYFDEQSRIECARSHRYGQALSILMLDLDKFKQVNDTYGHAAGDEVLKSIVHVGLGALRKSDILARFGGEEFVVLLPHADIKEASMLAERLRKAIENTEIMADGAQLKVTVSIGVSILAASESDSIEMLSRADYAMYNAKHGGRNRVDVMPAPVA
ncbi:MAG TPA: GGDEF domain-containing protein [Methylophilaceae bacterium]|jgi:diguanylate cyclase (GGDEF)-like protein